jgi:hypothetical protein
MRTFPNLIEKNYFRLTKKYCGKLFWAMIIQVGNHCLGHQLSWKIKNE